MKPVLAVVLTLLVSSLSLSQSRQRDFTRLVNPFVGTGAHGHTFPGATLPFGMVQLSPDTRLTGWDGCSGYHYSDHIIYGFSHTHLSGTGIPDYGDILLMPTTGEFHFEAAPDEPDRGYASRFSHQNETARPGYYSVKLDDDNILAELTDNHPRRFSQILVSQNGPRQHHSRPRSPGQGARFGNHYCGQDPRRRVSQIGILGEGSVRLLCD